MTYAEQIAQLIRLSRKLAVRDGAHEQDSIKNARDEEALQAAAALKLAADTLAKLAPPDSADLGATGNFPAGKLNEDDEGELRFAIGNVNGNVGIHFGKPVDWFALPPVEALKFAETILKHSGLRTRSEQMIRNIIFNVEQNLDAHTVPEIMRNLRQLLGLTPDERP